MKALIKEAIISQCYLSWEQHSKADLGKLCEENGWSESDFLEIVRELERTSLLENYAQHFYEISVLGIEFAEKQGIVNANTLIRRREVRRRIVDWLSVFRRSEGRDECSRWEPICEDTQIEQDEFLLNEWFLREKNLIESLAIGCYRVTDYGYKTASAEQ